MKKPRPEINTIHTAASITRTPFRADYNFSVASRPFRVIDYKQETT